MSNARRRFAFGFVGYLLNLAAAATFITLGWYMQTRILWVAFGFIASAQFCYLYHRWSGGTWRLTIHGTHLMVFSASMAGIMALIVISQLGFLPLFLLPYFAAGVYITIAWLFLWRTSILEADQRAPREPDPIPEEH